MLDQTHPTIFGVAKTLIVATTGDTFFLADIVSAADDDPSCEVLVFPCKNGGTMTMAEIKTAIAANNKKQLNRLIHNKPLANCLAATDPETGLFYPGFVPKCRLMDIPLSVPMITAMEDSFEEYYLGSYLQKYKYHPQQRPAQLLNKDLILPNIALEKLIWMNRQAPKAAVTNNYLKKLVENNAEDTKAFLWEQKQLLQHAVDEAVSLSPLQNENQDLEEFNTEELAREKRKQHAKVVHIERQITAMSSAAKSVLVTGGFACYVLICFVAFPPAVIALGIVGVGLLSLLIGCGIYIAYKASHSNKVQNRLTDIAKAEAYIDRRNHIRKCQGMLTKIRMLEAAYAQQDETNIKGDTPPPSVVPVSIFKEKARIPLPTEEESETSGSSMRKAI